MKAEVVHYYILNSNHERQHFLLCGPESIAPFLFSSQREITIWYVEVCKQLLYSTDLRRITTLGLAIKATSKITNWDMGKHKQGIYSIYAASWQSICLEHRTHANVFSATLYAQVSRYLGFLRSSDSFKKKAVSSPHDCENAFGNIHYEMLCHKVDLYFLAAHPNDFQFHFLLDSPSGICQATALWPKLECCAGPQIQSSKLNMQM